MIDELRNPLVKRLKNVFQRPWFCLRSVAETRIREVNNIFIESLPVLLGE
jgi:hypothetical protein